MVQDQGEFWYRWRPAFAESAAYADIAEAVERFEPVDNDAGHAASNWLKHSSLDDYPSTATWLAYHNQRLEGFFAICSAEITLSERQRKERLGREGRSHEHRLHPQQPASLITWLGKHAETTMAGDSIIRYAAYIATQVLSYKGILHWWLIPLMGRLQNSGGSDTALGLQSRRGGYGYLFTKRKTSSTNYGGYAPPDQACSRIPSHLLGSS